MTERRRGFFARQADLRKGRDNEQKVEMALEQLIEQQKIITFWPAKHPDDLEGIDFTIMTHNGDEILLQVKSSKYGMRKFREKHPDISVVLVEDGDDMDRIAMKVINCTRKK